MQNQQNQDENFLRVYNFATDYGCFLIWLGSFEFRLEVLIWYLENQNRSRKISARRNCLKINGWSIKKKRDKLQKLLPEAHRKDIIDTANNVIALSDRDAWIHCHIAIIGSNFERMFRLRVKAEKHNTKHIEYKELSPHYPPFKKFMREVERFEKITEAIGLTHRVFEKYLASIQQE